MQYMYYILVNKTIRILSVIIRLLNAVITEQNSSQLHAGGHIEEIQFVTH